MLEISFSIGLYNDPFWRAVYGHAQDRVVSSHTQDQVVHPSEQ